MYMKSKLKDLNDNFNDQTDVKIPGILMTQAFFVVCSSSGHLCLLGFISF